MTDLPLHLVTEWLNVLITLGIVGLGLWRGVSSLGHFIGKRYFEPIIERRDNLNGKVADHDEAITYLKGWTDRMNQEKSP